MYCRSLRVSQALVPCILFFQISLSEYSEVGRVLAGLEPSARSPFEVCSVVSEGPVVSVSLLRLFPELVSGFLEGSGGGSLCFGRVANRRFNAS